MDTHDGSGAATAGLSRSEKLAKAHGVLIAAEVIQVLEAAGFVCCVVGIKALRYYGAPRPANDWRICVPDDVFQEAVQLMDGMYDKYRRVDPPSPSLLKYQALWHEHPHFRPTTYTVERTTFFIMPSSEELFERLDASVIERSANGIPYPKLEVFAQNLLNTQQWFNLTHLVDGMDLSLEWGQQNLRLGEPSTAEVEYAKMKNGKYSKSREHLPESDFPRGVKLMNDTTSLDRTEKWARIVRKKSGRIDPLRVQAGYMTQHRSKNSGDPRLRQGKPV